MDDWYTIWKWWAFKNSPVGTGESQTWLGNTGGNALDECWELPPDKIPFQEHLYVNVSLPNSLWITFYCLYTLAMKLMAVHRKLEISL